MCEEAALTDIDRNLLGRRVFINDYIYEGAPNRVKRGRLT